MKDRYGRDGGHDALRLLVVRGGQLWLLEQSRELVGGPLRAQPAARFGSDLVPSPTFFPLPSYRSPLLPHLSTDAVPLTLRPPPSALPPLQQNLMARHLGRRRIRISARTVGPTAKPDPKTSDADVCEARGVALRLPTSSSCSLLILLAAHGRTEAQHPASLVRLVSNAAAHVRLEVGRLVVRLRVFSPSLS